MHHVCLNQTNLFISHLCQIQSTTFNARKTNKQSSTEFLLDNGVVGIRTHGRHLSCSVAFSTTLAVFLINNIPGKIAKLAPDQVWSQPFFSRARQKNSWHSNFKIYASWKKRKKRLITDPDSQLAAPSLYDTVWYLRSMATGRYYKKITLVFLSRNRVKDL